MINNDKVVVKKYINDKLTNYKSFKNQFELSCIDVVYENKYFDSTQFDSI